MRTLLILVATSLFSLGSIAHRASAEPLEKPISGPAMVCFKYSTFLLNKGESVTDFTAYTESMSISVKTQSGRIIIGESEIFAGSADRRLIMKRNQTNVFATNSRYGAYIIYGPTSYSNDKDVALLTIGGDAVHSDPSDASIYERIEIRDPKEVKCRMRFIYSW